MSSRIHKSCRSIRGFSLLEVMVYVGVFAFILGLSLEAYYRSEQNGQRLTRNAMDILSAMRAGERWREDLRHAVRLPTLEMLADSTEFKIPQASGTVRYVFRGKQILRQGADSLAEGTLLPHVETSGFYLESRGTSKAWRWELELTASRKHPKTKPLFSFLAPVPSSNQP